MAGNGVGRSRARLGRHATGCHEGLELRRRIRNFVFVGLG